MKFDWLVVPCQNWIVKPIKRWNRKRFKKQRKLQKRQERIAELQTRPVFLPRVFLKELKKLKSEGRLHFSPGHEQKHDSGDELYKRRVIGYSKYQWRDAEEEVRAQIIRHRPLAIVLTQTWDLKQCDCRDRIPDKAMMFFRVYDKEEYLEWRVWFDQSPSRFWKQLSVSRFEVGEPYKPSGWNDKVDIIRMQIDFSAFQEIYQLAVQAEHPQNRQAA